MRFLIIVALLSVLILVIGCTDGITGNTVKLQSPIQTCKDVKVPYQVIEQYQVPLKYERVSGTTSTTLHGFDVWGVGKVKIRNVDSETGLFFVEQTFSTLNDGEIVLESSQYIMPGETKEFREEFDISLGEDFKMKYLVSPGEKTLTRSVTKYRTEEKCE